MDFGKSKRVRVALFISACEKRFAHRVILIYHLMTISRSFRAILSWPAETFLLTTSQSQPIFSQKFNKGTCIQWNKEQ